MFTINGIGTTLYGSADKKEDGSYIATKWIVFIWIPIIPLASYRVFHGENVKGFFIYYHSQKIHLAKVKMNWNQIGKMYLKVYGTFVMVMLAIVLLRLLVVTFL